MSNNAIEILFAEDNTDDAKLTMRALKKAGLTNFIFHVRDGAEALDFMYCKGIYASQCLHTKPKLILLDLKMPKVSGIEVLEKLKSDPVFRTIPIVILTSSNEDPDIKLCYELGANSYIVKPVEGDNFFKTIKELSLYWVILNHPPK
jgi:CheY-like chemotaxis protein